MQCTVCGKLEDEVRRLIKGPLLELGTDAAVQLTVCNECVAALDELVRTLEPGRDGGERSGMRCSFCAKTHAEVAHLALCARFYRVDDEIQRVVHYKLFFHVYGHKNPRLLAEVAICNECVELCKEVLAEDAS
jgi:hypothetical protein